MAQQEDSIYVNKPAKKTSGVPRHNEITNDLGTEICKDLPGVEASELVAGDSGTGYGWRVITSVPFMNGPSHESAPKYAAVSASAATRDAEPVSVAVHAGVGSLVPPAGKTIVNVSVVPDIVPENVPVLFR